MPSARTSFGGQAVVEGVMVRGPRAAAVVVRRPDGELATRTERLGGVFTGALLRRVPFVRGMLVLVETLILGLRALTWSGAIATNEVDDEGNPPPLGVAGGIAIAFGLAVTASIFFVGPALAVVWLRGAIPLVLVVALEGVLRLGLLLLYVWNLGRSPRIGRVFQYHGAEHMAIQAFEHGLELTVPAVRRFDKEHPRCGTSFLLTVVIVSVFVFLPFASGPWWWFLGSRIVLVPLVAGVAYEAIRLGARYSSVPVVRWLFTANIALQHLTTREPDDAQVQVAIAAVHACVLADSAEG